MSIYASRIELENLRRHRQLSVPLSRTTVLLGHDNVGKSAVMDALGLLANISRHGPFMFSSYAKYTFQAMSHPSADEVECQIDFYDSKSTSTGRYAIRFGATPPPTSYLDVKRELLEIDESPFFERRDNASGGALAGPLTPYLANAGFFAALASGQRRLGTLAVPLLVDELRFMFRSIGQYRMVANFISDAGTASPVQGAFPTVNRQGNGLTALLVYLQEFEPEALELIADDLQNAVDGFESIEFAPAAQPQESEFRVKFRDSRGAIPAPQLSNGTLNLIGLVTVLRSPRQFRFLCLEEPELGLTPKSIKHLVQTLVEGPSPLGAAAPQTLITTHSPYLLPPDKRLTVPVAGVVPRRERVGRIVQSISSFTGTRSCSGVEAVGLEVVGEHRPACPGALALAAFQAAAAQPVAAFQVRDPALGAHAIAGKPSLRAVLA